MQAYIYDNDRFYVGEMTCQIDPLESQKQGKDIFLTPANSTSKKPTIIEGAKPRWTGTAWEQYPDDKLVYGYTNNDDGTINYYGSNHLAEELQRIYKEVTLSFSDTEPVSVDGVYWLSADNPDYIKAKEAHDKAEALAELDAQYDRDKADIMNYYTQAVFAGDEEEQAALKIEMAEIDAQYIEDRKALEEAE
jgi:hypothetical protein